MRNKKHTYGILPEIARDFFCRFSRNRSSLVGLGMVALIVILGWIVPLFMEVDAFKMVGKPFLPPSGQYLFGTDDMGRNVFHQVVVGAQTSMMVGFAAGAMSTVIGLLVGATAGYWGAKIDAFLMRVAEYFMVIPMFLLALVLVSIIGASILNIVLVIGILSWPRTARLVRSEFLRLKNYEFVDAAKAVGARSSRIMFYEILPNALPPIIANTALEIGSAILLEAGISFLGLGDPRQVSWGVILYQAQLFMRRAPWVTIFSGLAIFITVMGLNLVADGINEALNPKFRRIASKS